VSYEEYWGEHPFGAFLKGMKRRRDAPIIGKIPKKVKYFK
jgi:hypothetical protein